MRLRRARLPGNRIAREAGVSPATVSRVLRRAKLSRVRDLEPREPVRRYQRDRPGELLHIDIKKLGRFQKAGHRVTGSRAERSNGRPGWECVHVCVDDASRVAFTAIHRDETAASATAFLRDAVAYYESLGVRVERVMTDNGSCYTSRAFAAACRTLGLRHIRTRPYSPKTNGKAERFIQTALTDRPARMGLRQAVPNFRTQSGPVAGLDTRRQLAPKPLRHKLANTHQPNRHQR